MFENWPLLSIQIWMPMIGAILVLFTGGDENKHIARGIAVGTAVLAIIFCIPLYMNFDVTTYAMQFTENVSWVSAYNVNYALGVDGISVSLILLTTFTTLIVILAACTAIKDRVAQYMALFLIMHGMLVGVFAATDAVLFYVFWEATLIPMYLSIGMWGGSNRSYASIKFFLYTFFGSVLMLVAMLYLGMHVGSFAIEDLYFNDLGLNIQILIFIAFFFAFAVKVPMWPVHTWLPDAHTEAPAGGSVVLAALMLKMGIYGFLRFSMPITPLASQYLDYVMIVLSLIAIIYIGLVALAQTDMKRLIAYSSISHMGIATLGCFMVYVIIGNTGNYEDAFMCIEGATVQMVAHAFGSGAMFLGIGFMYDRMHTRLIGDFGGIASKMPAFAAFFMLFAMTNVGLPGTSGFVGEFMVILSAFQGSPWIALLAATTLILGAAYTLWMYARVFFGKVTSDKVKRTNDIQGVEWLTYSLLAAGVLILGLYPECMLRLLHSTVRHLLTQSLQFSLPM